MSNRRIATCVAIGLGALAALGLGWAVLRPANEPPLPPGVSQDEYRLAVQGFEQRYGRPADRMDSLSWLGESALRRERWEIAAACFAAIPLDHPRYGRAARHQLGQVWLRLNRAAAAEQALREFIQAEEQAPRSPPEVLIDARQRLRYLYEVELRFEERHALLQGTLERNEADAFELAAGCFPTLLRWNGTQAAGWVEAFAAATPEDPAVRLALARFRTAQGTLEEAERLLSDLRRERPADRAILAAWIAYLAERGDTVSLQTALAELPPADGDEPWLLQLWRARGHVARGETPAAVEQLAQLIQRVPTHMEAWQELVLIAQADPAVSAEFLAGANRRVQALGGIANRLGWSVQNPDELQPWTEIIASCRQAGFHAETRHLARGVLRMHPQAAGLQDVPNDRSPDALSDELTALSGIVLSGRAKHLTPRAVRPESVLTDSPSDIVPLRFREVALELGVEFHRYDDIHGQKRIHEETGGGVAILDYDGDGRLDLGFTNGCRLPLREATDEHRQALYRQTATGRFEEVANRAGCQASGYFGGILAADWDNDGFTDLLWTGYRSVRAWRNQGDGTFSDVTAQFAVLGESWSTSAAAFDADRDGLLDLFVATYLAAPDDPPRLCRSPQSPNGIIACSPTFFPAQQDFFLSNRGDGIFVDETTANGLAGVDGKGLGVVAFDANQDGQSELYVANDGTPCFLYERPQDSGERSSYQDFGLIAGVALDGEGRATAAMGVAVGDFDRDGWNDLYKTNFYLEPNTLYRNLEGQGFVDVSAVTRVGPPSRATLGFGCLFFDADLDGWPDLFVGNGHIEDREWGGEPYRMPPHLFRNRRDGTFLDQAPDLGGYWSSPALARGVAVGDLNRDGREDLVVSHQLGRSAVLLNETAPEASCWTFRCVGREASNRDGIGVRMTAIDVQPTLMRERFGGGSFQSTCGPELQFAGMTGPTAFRIVWPDGTVATTSALPSGRYVIVQGRPPLRLTTEGAPAQHE